MCEKRILKSVFSVCLSFLDSLPKDMVKHYKEEADIANKKLATMLASRENDFNTEIERLVRFAPIDVHKLGWSA